MVETEELRKQVEELSSFLRSMRPKEIADIYDISKSYASVVKTAADNVKTLLDPSLSTSDIAEKMDITVNTIKSYLAVLKKIDIEVDKIRGED